MVHDAHQVQQRDRRIDLQTKRWLRQACRREATVAVLDFALVGLVVSILQGGLLDDQDLLQQVV